MKKIAAIVFIITIITLCPSGSFAQKSDSLPSRVYSWDSLQVKKEGNSIIKPVMSGSTTALSDFEVHVAELEAGKEPLISKMLKEKEQLIIIKEGQLRITIKGVSKILGAGSIAYTMQGDASGIANVGKTKAVYYVLTYKSKLPANTGRANQNGGSFMIDWNSVALNKNEKGARRNIFNRSTSHLEKFEMHTTALNAGLDSHAPHTHKEEEIILILRGDVKMYIDGSLHKAVPGDVVFLSSGVPHALKNTGSEQSEYFAFQWRN